MARFLPFGPGYRPSIARVTELWRYERALEQRNLAVSLQAGQSLMRRQETQDILALLRVLADSSDTLAFGSLMRGPLVGLHATPWLELSISPTRNSKNFVRNARRGPKLKKPERKR